MQANNYSARRLSACERIRQRVPKEDLVALRRDPQRVAVDRESGRMDDGVRHRTGDIAATARKPPEPPGENSSVRRFPDVARGFIPRAFLRGAPAFVRQHGGRTSAWQARPRAFPGTVARLVGVPADPLADAGPGLGLAHILKVP